MTKYIPLSCQKLTSQKNSQKTLICQFDLRHHPIFQLNDQPEKKKKTEFFEGINKDKTSLLRDLRC